MAKHKLKILSEYFQMQLESKKNFEIRKNDRNYHVGDLLILKEYDPRTRRLSGRYMIVEITYITNYMQKDGYVVLGTKPNYDWSETK